MPFLAVTTDSQVKNVTASDKSAPNVFRCATSKIYCFFFVLFFFTRESVSSEFVGMPPLNCWSKVKETSLILIYTMMHQHFLWPGSMWVCQHLAPPVRVNRLADMTCPAPVIELLTICLPWLSCCHISVHLIVAAVRHILIRCDKGIKEHFVEIIGFILYHRMYSVL